MADAVFWDPDPFQIGTRNGVPITPASLRDAGFEFVSRDCDSLSEEGARVDLWISAGGKKWYLVLRKGRGQGGKKICDALVFQSQQLSNVIERFRTVAEVL